MFQLVYLAWPLMSLQLVRTEKLNPPHIHTHIHILVVKDDRIAQQRIDDVGVVVELLVHHEGEGAHLGSAVIVLLLST